MPNSGLPKSMTCIAIREPGGPDVLVAKEQPVPSPGQGEILVKVAAAGVNRPDVIQRQGHYPPPKGATEIPGLEIAGEVVAIGPGVTRWRQGDKVMALVVGGGYAEYCLAFEGHALPAPPDLSMIEAAAVPETFVTVWHNVFERGKLTAGETLLVHGGSSGMARRPSSSARPMRLMLKRLTHTGSTLRARAVADKTAIARAVEKNVLPLLTSGRVKPLIDSTFPLRQAAAAHARIESGQHIGKIVLTL